MRYSTLSIKTIPAGLIFCLAICLGIAAVPSRPEKQIPSSPARAGWTFLLFSMADCNLEEPMMEDLRQMAEVGSNENVNLVVLCDRAEGNSNEPLLNIRNFTSAKYLLAQKGSFREIRDLGELNMGDPANLSNFISAGLAAIDAAHHPGNFLFVDLGTNGELVLKKGTRFAATSTAAGPAFEGMTISCGMLALPGAVYKAEERDDGGTAVETVGDRPARGVCGTGLLDLLAAALRQGRLSPQGHIVDGSKKIPVAGPVELTQKDVREVQLAAAAVKTGIRMLLEANGTSVADLDTLYVAGAFGNYLNIPNAMALGLLPRLPTEKIRFIGNSSLAGARAMLISAVERKRCEALVGKIDHESLARGAAFQELFVEAPEFKEWS